MKEEDGLGSVLLFLIVCEWMVEPFVMVCSFVGLWVGLLVVVLVCVLYHAFVVVDVVVKLVVWLFDMSVVVVVVCCSPLVVGKWLF